MVLIKKSKVLTPKCNFSNDSLHIRCLTGIFFMVMELMSVAYVGLPVRDRGKWNGNEIHRLVEMPGKLTVGNLDGLL